MTTATASNIPQQRGGVDLLLARLMGVHRVRAGRWVARCPAHRDRSPSLSITLTEAGKVLLHCFAGCPTQAILDAVGLTWRDISQPRTDEDYLEAQLRQRLDGVCFRAACAVAEWAHVLDVESYAARYALTPYLHLVPYLDDLRDRLLADDVPTRLEALREAEPWV